ncbi:hypothetical protein IFO70_22160 [Phormidium tenue FACHB-886]|nr:hypothetical protein [Phormidium tenue FACHB-886]
MKGTIYSTPPPVSGLEPIAAIAGITSATPPADDRRGFCSLIQQIVKWR